MNNVIYLILRRLRLPLILLISVYAVSVAGLTLIPGRDDQGNLWHMDFFHAFYVVSYMGSTIGFGEIPYPFTEAQRMWVTFSIYITVTAWLYGIGNILSLVQDKNFRHVLAFTLFSRKVRSLREPFYLICGYGDTGRLLVAELARRHIACAVIDSDESCIQALELEDLPVLTPGFSANAQAADILTAAGLDHAYCRGIVALTPDDSVNLKIAITAKLLRPGLQVICRSESEDTAANMASFGTDHIVNPFHVFADSFAMTFNSPSMHLVFEWVTAMHDQPLEDFVTPPIGDWVLCGYGRFGKVIYNRLRQEGIPVTVVEAMPHRTNPPQGTIQGRGTEASTLNQAGIHEAVGIIAGTNDDANNLSILMTAADINRKLFTVARLNEENNQPIFDAYGPDFLMQPSRITAQRILSLIITPLLNDFLKLARRQDEDWANILVSSVAGLVADSSPETWAVRVDQDQAPAIIELSNEGHPCQIEHVLHNPHQSNERLTCIPLMLKRRGYESLSPDLELILQPGDEILFCGTNEAHDLQKLSLANYNMLSYVVLHEDRPAGTVWRWLHKQSQGA